MYVHILNGDLESQSMTNVDPVKAILSEQGGVDVDRWKIKVIVGWM